jgi:hypothetical protein
LYLGAHIVGLGVVNVAEVYFHTVPAIPQ